jgi:hypothetical protein
VFCATYLNFSGFNTIFFGFEGSFEMILERFVHVVKEDSCLDIRWVENLDLIKLSSSVPIASHASRDGNTGGIDWVTNQIDNQILGDSRGYNDVAQIHFESRNSLSTSHRLGAILPSGTNRSNGIENGSG